MTWLAKSQMSSTHIWPGHWRQHVTFSLVDGKVVEPDMSAGFCPDHKAAMVLFLDRVYGIEVQDFLLHLLEVGFLPDLRAAASLDTVWYEKCTCTLDSEVYVYGLTHPLILNKHSLHTCVGFRQTMSREQIKQMLSKGNSLTSETICLTGLARNLIRCSRDKRFIDLCLTWGVIGISIKYLFIIVFVLDI